MTAVPGRPKIYNIAHVDRLPSIIADGFLWSDTRMAGDPRPGSTIGMGTIKARRRRLLVKCHAGDRVADFVPFYFCPRSVMLYVIHCANNPELEYRDGQGAIVHLQADALTAIDWAEANGRRWAVSLSNAGATYSEFRAHRGALGELNWTAIASTDFRSPEVKEAKQAEFLMHHDFPWHLIERVGVLSVSVRNRVAAALALAKHRPPIEVLPDWYF